MKFTKLVLGIGLTLALYSCGTTKTTTTTAKKDIVQITADRLAKKKGKLNEEELQRWSHMDVIRDTVPGISVERAYEFLGGKKGKKVIVGVIDSGIDIEHEDLKNVLWTNKDEIPNNGKDDDNNGYADDVYGWNFLGGEAGKDVPEQLEIARIVAKLKPRFDGKTANEIAPKDKEDFEYYTKLYEEVQEKRQEALGSKVFYEGILNTVKSTHKAIAKQLGKEDYTLEDMEALKPDESIDEQAKMMLMKLKDTGRSVDEGLEEIQGGVDHFTAQADNHYNIDFRGRQTDDNIDDLTDTDYGNPLVIGSKEVESHGTHVAGIICAERNNGVGINGVAHNVALMTVRAVPDGDEYDKDVALAIRYAVDNGAKIINMSFGKGYSPHANWVYDAIKYAEGKDVLLVHAAGNDGEDIDVTDNFPNDSREKLSEFADNMLTVGAITYNLNESLVAGFSNYGIKNVDIFAPGYSIYSSVPQDKYDSYPGTSMAAPHVTGVAALIRSYYPQLSARQVKHIIMDSGAPFHEKVNQPTERSKSPKKVPFSSLSVSGKILNAYNALVLADKMANEK